MLAFLLHQRDQNALCLKRERDMLERWGREHTAALSEDIRFRKRVEQQLAQAQRLSQVGSWELGAGPA